ncbi:TlpA family protein disulfide reductase [Cellulophaga sp. Z1A5H]|uniref:TlpA family protein disulfide reductase n=1 Tax=Cellulophaga sp. Z1A5H TaxID=2687291 RepID=UPI0013FE392C|nr:TlpA disulfide reductase family protein [Cellulophaga sp. Z1A5H]
MKLTKDKIINLAVLIAAGIILFTPLGFPVKVFVNKLISFAPTEVSKDEQLKLTDYNWKLISSDQQSLNFEQYKNSVIVINFWATWCPPCVAEMPSFQDLYDDYGTKVVFLFVTNEEVPVVDAFMKKKGYTLPVYYPQNTTPSILKSSAIPATFVISKTGEITIDKTGAADWNSESTRALLDRLLEH